jgi:hypothetical protein
LQFVVTDEEVESSEGGKIAVSAGSAGDPHFHVEQIVRKPDDHM